MRAFGPADLNFLLLALRWTLLLSIFAFVGGGLVGAALTALRLSGSGFVRAAALAYMQFVQGLPLLVILFLCYYGVGLAGAEVSATVAAALGLSLYSSAFLAMIWESSIRAVPKGQWEGAAALGLDRWLTIRLVIAQQAVRLAIPPSVGFLVQVVKQTSLASIIGFVEVTRAGQLISNATLEPLKAFGAVAVFYFIICFLLSTLSRRLENRVSLPGARV